jgi:hypothetical protein
MSALYFRKWKEFHILPPEEGVEYLYKLDNKGRFVMEMGGHRLLNRDLDSAASTFRKM